VTATLEVDELGEIGSDSRTLAALKRPRAAPPMRSIRRVFEMVGSAALGALATLFVTWWLTRDSASRAARRDTYLELLKMLKAALRVQQGAVLDHSTQMPDVISNDQIDEFNARIELDTSPEVRRLAVDAFALAQRFNAAHGMGVPVDVGDDGLYLYRFDQHPRQIGEESAHLMLRMSLATIRGDLVTKVDQLAARVRREVHGGRS